MAEFRNRSIARERWVFLLSLVALALAFVAGSILWYSVEISSVSEVQRRVNVMKPIFTGTRLFLIALVAFAWPSVVGGMHRRGRIDEVARVTLVSLRWRLVLWLMVIELVVGQNLLNHALTAVQGGRA
tara:strand:- start:381 stop:764 length:384 start_codon:yes stop_codon:yes gene_type:complete